MIILGQSDKITLQPPPLKSHIILQQN